MDTKKFKETLLAEQTLLEGELGNIARLNSENGQWEATPDADLMNQSDDNDAADRFEDFEERTSMMNTLQDRWNDIKNAIAKIDKGTFGMCEAGNDHPIEKDRLEANPAARMCKKHMNG